MTHLDRVGWWFGAERGQQAQAQALHVQQGIFPGGQRRMHLFKDLRGEGGHGVFVNLVYDDTEGFGGMFCHG